MWQPWQALANRSSPLRSINLGPLLMVCVDAESPGLCAFAPNESSCNAADIVAAMAMAALMTVPVIEPRCPSSFDDAIVQPRDCIECRQDRPLLPGRNVRRVLTRQNDPAIDLAEIVVMLGSCLFGPAACAAQGEGHPMPGDRDAVLEFGAILRMQAGTEFDGARNPLGGLHRRKFIGIGVVVKVGAEKDAPARTVESGVWIGDLPNRQIGVADAAVDRFVLLPEAALELQADLDGWRVRHRVDGCFHRAAHIDRDLTQYRKRNRADAPIGSCLQDRRRRFEVGIGDGYAAVVLLDPGHLRLIANEVADF